MDFNDMHQEEKDLSVEQEQEMGGGGRGAALRGQRFLPFAGGQGKQQQDSPEGRKEIQEWFYFILKDGTIALPHNFIFLSRGNTFGKRCFLSLLVPVME